MLAEQQDQPENSVFTEHKFDCGAFCVCIGTIPTAHHFSDVSKSPFKSVSSQEVS